MVLNKYLIFDVLQAKLVNPNLCQWTVEGAKLLGDIYLRPNLDEMETFTAVQSALSSYHKDFSAQLRCFHPFTSLFVRRYKGKYEFVLPHTNQPILILIRDGSWR